MQRGQRLVVSPGRASGALGEQWAPEKVSRSLGCDGCVLSPPEKPSSPCCQEGLLLSFGEKKAIFARKNDVAEEGRWGGNGRSGKERAHGVPVQAAGSPVPPAMLAQGLLCLPTPPHFLRVLPTRLLPREDLPKQPADALAKQPVFEDGKAQRSRD